MLPPKNPDTDRAHIIYRITAVFGEASKKRGGAIPIVTTASAGCGFIRCFLTLY